MNVEVRQELGALAAAWDHLAAAQELPSPFLLSWWVDHAAGGTPAIVCCFDGEALIGGAAFELDRFGPGPAKVERVRFLGQGPLQPDHLDVIAADGRRSEVVTAVVDWLLAGNRIIDLDGLAATSDLAARLGAPILSEVAAPTLELKHPDPLADRPGKLRSTVKRSTNRLAKLGYEVRRAAPAEAERAMDDLLALHEVRWAEDSKLTGGWDRLRAAAVEGIRNGDVVVFELAGEDGVIASELVTIAGDHAAFYQAGRLTEHEYRGSGSVVRAAAIRWAAECGMDEYDLLRGDEPYKDDWTSSRRWVRRIRMGVGPGGRAVAGTANATFRGAPKVVDVAERVIGEERTDRAIQSIVSTVRGMSNRGGGEIADQSTEAPAAPVADADRIQREKDFHDERFADDHRPAGRFYTVAGSSSSRYEELVQGIEPPAKVLELGCGLQAQMWGLLDRGVEVTAIDISDTAIDITQERYAELGLAGGEFHQMNAEALEFDEGSFDAVVGSGILHHLDIERGTAEAARVLRPDGRFILLEPMGQNPAVNLYRRFTPDQRTDDEHPLVMSDFDILRRHFERVELQFFHLTSLGAMALLKTSKFDSALESLERADQRIFDRIPWLRRMAWMVVVDAVGPRPTA